MGDFVIVIVQEHFTLLKCVWGKNQERSEMFFSIITITAGMVSTFVKALNTL